MVQPLLWSVLGVPRGASVEEINRQYRKLAFDLHPDRNKNPDAEDQIKLLNLARATLVDEAKRTIYEASLLSRRPGDQHAWFCPICSGVRVFVSQHAWRCNVCGLTGKLFHVAAYIGGEVAKPARGPAWLP